MRSLLHWFVALAAVSGVSGCDGVTTVEGRVVANGDPQQDATVVLGGEQGDPPYSRQTEADGKFEITRAHAPRRMKLKLTVSKVGYADYEESVDAGGVHKVQVELKPANDKPAR